MIKTAQLLAIGLLTLGLLADPVQARDGRGNVRGAFAEKGKAADYRKVVHRHRGEGRHPRAQRAGYRHWRRDRSHWTPRRKSYRRHHRGGHPLWHPHRPRHKHGHWKRHRHGDSPLFGILFGAAIGAILSDTLGGDGGKAHASTGTPVRPAPAPRLVGEEIGGTMAAADQSHAAFILETARTGHAIEWTNPATGNRYTVTPTRTYRNALGEDCRDFTVWGWVEGFEENHTGSACRTGDGNWRAVS